VTEALVDGVTGIKIRAGNPRDLQGAIDILARNPEMRIRMGMAGRCKVEEEFGAHSMARKVEALYTRLGCTAVP
jgi:glycosyltransferase involved in cell wall biosynthesis